MKKILYICFIYLFIYFLFIFKVMKDQRDSRRVEENIKCVYVIMLVTNSVPKQSASLLAPTAKIGFVEIW